MKTVTRKKTKRSSPKQAKGTSTNPKNLVIILSLIVVLFLTVISLQQTQSIRQEAATVPSAVCMGSCPKTSPSQAQLPPTLSGIVQPGSGGQPSLPGGQQGGNGNILAMLMNLLSSLFGGFGGGNLPPGIQKNFSGGNLPPGIQKKFGGGLNINGSGIGAPGTSGTGINGSNGGNGLPGINGSTGGGGLPGTNGSNGGTGTSGSVNVNGGNGGNGGSGGNGGD